MIETILQQEKHPIAYEPQLELPASAPIIIANHSASPVVFNFVGALVKVALSVAFAGAIGFVAYSFVLMPYRFKQDSTLPIKTTPLVVGEKISYMIRKPFIGEIVVFKSPDAPSLQIGAITGIDLQLEEYAITTAGPRTVSVALPGIASRVYYPQASYSQDDARVSTDIPLIPYKVPAGATLSGVMSTPLPLPKVTPTPTKKPASTSARKPAPPTPTRAPQPPLPTSAPTPTPVPGRTPNPPIVTITYPGEMATLAQATTRVCLTENPSGGDTSGLKHRYSINSQSWTDYAAMSTVCFTALDGDNTVRLQYRNSYGEESGMYTRQFTLALPTPTSEPTATTAPTPTPVPPTATPTDPPPEPTVAPTDVPVVTDTPAPTTRHNNN